MDTNNKVNFKVKGNSNVHNCSLSLFKLIEEGRDVEVSAIGAAAVNQAVKIIVRARASMAQMGKDLTVRPGMKNEVVNDKELSLTIFNFKVV